MIYTRVMEVINFHHFYIRSFTILYYIGVARNFDWEGPKIENILAIKCNILAKIQPKNPKRAHY